MAGGEVVVPDGYSDRSELKTKYAAGALFPLKAAKIMNWEVFNSPIPGLNLGFSVVILGVGLPSFLLFCVRWQ